MATGGLYEQGSPGPASSTNNQLQTITQLQNIPTKVRIPYRIINTASDADKARNSRGRVPLQDICQQQNLRHSSFQYIYGTARRCPHFRIVCPATGDSTYFLPQRHLI